MAESLKSTYDFVKSAFAVRVGVLSSQDAEILSQKNNLSFHELIQPFCTLTNEAHIQGIGNQGYRAYNMHVRVSDIRQKTANIEKGAVQQMISDMVLKSGPNESIQNITVPCRQYDLSVNRSCPWMDTYRDLIIRFGPQQDHEFLNHHVACMLVVSSCHPNPLQEFANLSHLQNRIQHTDKDSSDYKWMTANTLKYFVLLHDVQESSDEKAKEVFSSLQGMYGSKVCYLLRINSRESCKETGYNLPDPWCHFMNFSATSLHKHAKDIVNSLNSLSINGAGLLNQHDSSNEQWFQELQQSCENPDDTGFGCCLTLADHDQLRMFMQDFIVQALIPHMEKTIKSINEQISARKAIHKSLFRATRTLFGSNKSPGSQASSGYNQDANELLLRKIADLCFLSQMYDQAFYFYHNAKKDYTNDQAWLYTAGASELAAVANFMQRNAQKTYPAHYMESAITTYIDVCKNDYLALRCSLVHAECLQLLGMFNEAAFYLIKVTSEADDLRSALLLEQAAHCFLKLKDPQPRKFAFHLILAGHRFSKCAQRRHALRCYSLALQVYLDQGWGLAEDHINFTMARQSFNMKQLSTASDSFRNLLTQESFQSCSQQAAFFHEFIHIFQQCQQQSDRKEEYANLNLPKLLDCQTRVFLEYSKESEVTGVELNSKIRRLENALLHSESLSSSSMVSSIKCFSNVTSNTLKPVTAVQELIKIKVVWKNFLNIPIFLSNLNVQWKFRPTCSDEEVLSKVSNDFVKCSSINRISIAGLAEKGVEFIAQPLLPGTLFAVGITYFVGLSSDEETGAIEESADTNLGYSVKDHQTFNIHGRRLNKTKEEQTSVMYEGDCRLSFQVLDVLPKVSATFDNFPSDMKCNEVIRTNLTLHNSGKLPVDTIKILSEDNMHLTLCDTRGNKFMLPNANASSRKIQAYQDFPNLLSVTLFPGETVKFDVWIKALEYPGIHRVDILVYCRPNSHIQSLRSNAFISGHRLSCEQVIEVNPFLMTALGQHVFVISLHIKNVSTVEGFILYVDDVTCPTENCKVELLSGDSHTGLSAGSNLSLYLKLKRQEHKIDASTRTVVCNEFATACEPIQVIVHWRGTYEGKKTCIEGQHCVNLDEMFSDLGTFLGDQPRYNQPDQREVSLQTLHKLVSWRLQYRPSVRHDFGMRKLCWVSLTLVLCNLSNLELVVTISIPAAGGDAAKSLGQAPFTWVGTAEVEKVLQPHAKGEVELAACFSRCGIFNISSVSVTAIPKHLEGSTLQLPQKPPCGYFISIEE